MNNKRIEYHEHKFVIRTLELIGEGFKKDPRILEHKVNQPYQYVKEVNYELMNIQHTLETLRFCRVFIAEKHPTVHDYNEEKSSISVPQYLRYHIETYFLRITTYKDQILKLFAIVHGLQISKGLGFEKSLRKKTPEGDLDTLNSIIESLEKLIFKVKPIRNKIAHEGYHHDTDLGMLAAGLWHIKTQGADISWYNEDRWINFLKRTIMENITEMLDNEKSMNDNFFWVLDLLSSAYDRRIGALRS